MKCPFCGNEMTAGEVAGEPARGLLAVARLYWIDEAHPATLFHRGKPLRSDVGDTYENILEQPSIDAYKCANCRKIIMEAYTEDDDR